VHVGTFKVMIKNVTQQTLAVKVLLRATFLWKFL